MVLLKQPKYNLLIKTKLNQMKLNQTNQNETKPRQKEKTIRKVTNKERSN